MEYQFKIGFLIGILGTIFWSIHFWKIFKPAELFLPIKKDEIFSLKKGTKGIVFFMGLISWGLLTYGLMRPKKIIGYDSVLKKMNDIYIILDVSRSMLAIDFSPNRLEVAKKKIIDFINMNPTDRVGIILFSERIYTLMPLTEDFSIVRDALRKVTSGPLGNGTNIGDALALAVARSRLTPTKNQSLILLTDGVSQVDSIAPIEAAKLAKKNNIKIYSIGVGSDGKAMIPTYYNGLGGTSDYQEIPGGSLDVDLLKKISSLTGGSFYLAKDADSLKDIFKKIESKEKSLIKSQGKIAKYKDFSYRFFLMGVILLIISDFIRKVLLREVL